MIRKMRRRMIIMKIREKRSVSIVTASNSMTRISLRREGMMMDHQLRKNPSHKE